MADPASFIVSTTLGAAGLLLAFQGAVDGFNTLTEVFASDTGLHYTALQYQVETFKFKLWGEHFKINDPSNCQILDMPYETQVTIGRILAEIWRKQETAGDTFLGTYDLQRSVPAAQGPAAVDFSKGSVWIGSITDQKVQKPANFWKRLKWTLKHREQFTRLLSDLATLNQNLWDVAKLSGLDAKHIIDSILHGLDAFCERVRPKEVDEKQIATYVFTQWAEFWDKNKPEDLDVENMVARITAGVSDQLALTSAPQALNTPSSLVKLLAQVRAIQAMDLSQAAEKVKLITITSASSSHVPPPLEVNADPADTTGRHLGRYLEPEPEPSLLPATRVLIEYKTVSSSSPACAAIMLRIRALAGLLSATSPTASAFASLPCLALLDDEAYSESNKGAAQRLGIVYRLPAGSVSVPRSLLDTIRTAAQHKTRPALGERFRLAYRLASAVGLLHAAGWVHKGLRGDNVLLGPAADGENVRDGSGVGVPYLVGFQYSRPAGDESLEGRPGGAAELDVYYHPEVGHGWTKIKEVYSLGIVLLEVAYWRPAFEERFRKMKLREISKALCNDLDGEGGDRLKAMVGSIFVDVIKTCLKGTEALGVGSGDSEWEAKMLNDAFFDKVLRPLASCNA